MSTSMGATPGSAGDVLESGSESGLVGNPFPLTAVTML